MTLGLFFEYRENIAYPQVKQGLKIDRQAKTIAKNTQS
jgi:hypothetical protein